MYRKRISRLTYIILAFLLLVMGCGSLMATYTYDAGTVPHLHLLRSPTRQVGLYT